MEKKDIIRFNEGESVRVVLDTEPSKAKSYTNKSQYGTKTSYAIFCDNNRLIFATEKLYEKLLEFHKGDTVTITFSEKRWLVQGADGKVVSPLKQRLETEQMALLTQIAADIKEIKNTLYEQKTENKKYPSDEDIDKIDF